jgi:ABC-2 type transport system permease protein/lipopolysaccharide transport system permease protein
VWQNLVLRYRRTALGFLWTLLNPLLTMVVTSVVFSMIMRWPLKSFAVFLFSGLVPWIFFSNVLSQTSQALLANEALIKKIFVPKQIFVVAGGLSLLVDAIFSTVALLIMALALGAPLTLSLLLIPLNFLILFVFSIGISLTLSIGTVYFRDLPNIVSIVLQAGYYLTPILYPLDMVPERFRPYFLWNPMTSFVHLFRSPIYEGYAPDLAAYAVPLALSIVMFMIGISVFRRFSKFVVFRL